MYSLLETNGRLTMDDWRIDWIYDWRSKNKETDMKHEANTGACFMLVSCLD
jgi:hypothetical protein